MPVPLKSMSKSSVETLDQKIAKNKKGIAEMQKYLDETTLPEDGPGGRKDIKYQMDALSREGREYAYKAMVINAAAREKIRKSKEDIENQIKQDNYNKSK